MSSNFIKVTSASKIPTIINTNWITMVRPTDDPEIIRVFFTHENEWMDIRCSFNKFRELLTKS